MQITYFIPESSNMVSILGGILSISKRLDRGELQQQQQSCLVPKIEKLRRKKDDLMK
jgi:hypothetical protein